MPQGKLSVAALAEGVCWWIWSFLCPVVLPLCSQLPATNCSHCTQQTMDSFLLFGRFVCLSAIYCFLFCLSGLWQSCMTTKPNLW